MSVAEKFSQNVTKDKVGISALISAACDYFRGRILFLSGFIPMMDPRQIEIGMIPAHHPDTLTFWGAPGDGNGGTVLLTIDDVERKSE